MSTLNGQIGDPYVCAVCGGQYLRTRSDADAIASEQETWEPIPGEQERAIVCDDCYQRILEWGRREGHAV